MALFDLLNPIDRESLRDQVRRSTPVPNFLIDGFLKEDVASRISDAFPSFDEAVTVGRVFPDNIFDYRFVALSHNTVRGAAGSAILNAELLIDKGII